MDLKITKLSERSQMEKEGILKDCVSVRCWVLQTHLGGRRLLRGSLGLGAYRGHQDPLKMMAMCTVSTVMVAWQVYTLGSTHGVHREHVPFIVWQM